MVDDKAEAPRIWLVTIWEPLPVVDSNPRLLRTGLLARKLVEDGWRVTWWASTFDRAVKSQRSTKDLSIDVSETFRLCLLHVRGYRRNMSFGRIRYHQDWARRFSQAADGFEVPDLILCSWPPIEVCDAVTHYASSKDVPAVLDVRDPWPELIRDLIPRVLRPVVEVGLTPMRRAAARAARRATAIVGVSRSLVDFGLGYADRERTDLDVEFPIGYSESQPTREAIDAANRKWEQAGVTDGQFVVCFFGMMGKQTELDTVIDAAKLIAAQLPDVLFVICGEGDRRSEYQSMGEGLTNVIFPGWIGSAEIWTLMRRSRVGLAPYRDNPSFRFALPNKPYEYLSAGLPIVSSLGGELERLLSEHRCGVNYRTGDAAGLVGILARLHDHPLELNEMSRRAKDAFERYFRAEGINARYSSYLATVLRHRPAGTV